MHEAIDGNIDAYNELLFLAGQDIFVNLNMDKTDFDNQFNDLLSQYFEIQSLDDI